jgi:leader peptidase (prepilin peptidase)/N-methyltransferase
MFIFGACFGSFYNVVGYRLPRNMSIIYPSSHCTTCNHKLNIGDLFPIFSYILLKGKCRYCKAKVGIFYPIFETICGILFTICYLKYNFTFELLIALIFISAGLIIIISDYQTMIIPDEVLIVTVILLSIVYLIGFGFSYFINTIINGIVAFIVMFALKLLGDFMFKRESMGGGDIKLMFIFGMVLGWATAVLAIFLSAFIALPISLILVGKSDNHEIPFGPFLVIAAMLLLISGVDMNSLILLMIR